jgi:hypothetical protein
MLTGLLLRKKGKSKTLFIFVIVSIMLLAGGILILLK